jgi:two-component system, NarL family, nitrate/nitrite response regulator NarL
VIDGHPVARRGLSRAVEQASGMEVAATAGDLHEGILLAQELRPDVLVYSGTRAITEPAAIRACRRAVPDAGVLVLGTAESTAGAAIAAGAAGFLAKTAPVPLILESIAAVARGDSVVGRSIRGGGVRRVTFRRDAGPTLTVREWEVLSLLDEGFNAAQIAEQLIISRNTARNYVQNVLTKLSAHSKLEAVAVARRTGLLRTN